MDPDLEIATKNLGHLGIIASLVKEYSVVDIIDSLLPKDSNNQNLSHGEVVLGMILQGLGFSNQRLYLASEFFSHVAIFELFGRDVRADQFNAWTAGRTPIVIKPKITLVDAHSILTNSRAAPQRRSFYFCSLQELLLASKPFL